MAFLSSFNIIGSGLTAQQLRLDVISENITNQTTTHTESGGPYKRKTVVMEAESGKDSFRLAMDQALREMDSGTRSRRTMGYGGTRTYATTAWRHLSLSNRGYENAGGVRVTEIGEDDSDPQIYYDPSHPDANEEGYVEMPNITLVKEIADAMSASHAFNADVTAFNTLKQVVSSGLTIGK